MTVITQDPDWIELRAEFDPYFNQYFYEFYQLYKSGKWTNARDMLETLDSINAKDGPTLALKDYIVN